VCREAILNKKRSERVDVSLLVAVGVALSVGRTCGNAPGVVVGDVGDETAHCCWRSRRLVELSEQLGGRLDVGGPAEPASVTGIEVHDDVLHVERLDGVFGESLVCGRGVCTFGNVEVGHQVGQRIRFCSN